MRKEIYESLGIYKINCMAMYTITIYVTLILQSSLISEKKENYELTKI